MVLEGQEGGKKDMDLGSNGKKDGNQNKETNEQNQESQVIETPMNITSPCSDVAMAAEVTTDCSLVAAHIRSAPEVGRK